MASILQVETLQGPTSGANANKITIPAGQTLDASAGGMITPAGHIIQKIEAQFEETTISSSSVYTLFNEQITPTKIGNKIFVVAFIPNTTMTAGKRYTLNGYIGTSSTPTSNNRRLYCSQRCHGTGPDDVISSTFIGEDYVVTSTDTHYASLTLTTPSTDSIVIGRHSTTLVFQIYEVAG
jgi:hypothetical protein